MSPTLDRTRAILQAAVLTLRRHPRLLWFPVLSAVGTFAIVIVLLAASLAFEAVGHGSVTRGRVVGGMTLWYGVTFVTTMSAVALARATLDAMAGRAWTLSGSFTHAWSRLPSVAAFALVQTGVTRIIQRMRGGRGHRRRGFVSRTSAAMLDLAWWGTSYLAIPVLARENLGPLSTLSRSARLFRETWKESFVGRLALGWLWLPVALVVAIPIGLCVLLDVEDGAIVAIAIGIPLTLCGLAALLVRTLDTIYRTALYVFATEGVVPEPFDDPDLHEIWKVKPASVSDPR
jgi:uncharacterized membrane protein YesL